MSINSIFFLIGFALACFTAMWGSWSEEGRAYTRKLSLKIRYIFQTIILLVIIWAAINYAGSGIAIKYHFNPWWLIAGYLFVYPATFLNHKIITK